MRLETVGVWVAAKNNRKWDCLDRAECRKEDVPIGREATLLWYVIVMRNVYNWLIELNSHHVNHHFRDFFVIWN